MGSDSKDLSEELSELESATDGKVTVGHIVSEPSEVANDHIRLEIETTISKFTKSFEKPKPPLADYQFTRIAEEYGQGLTDVSALEGERIPCCYDDSNGEWDIVLPSQPRHKRIKSWFRQFEWRDVESGDFDELVLFTILGPAFIVIATFVSLTDENRKFSDGVFVGACAIFFWLFIISMVMLFVN